MTGQISVPATPFRATGAPGAPAKSDASGTGAASFAALIPQTATTATGPAAPAPRVAAPELESLFSEIDPGQTETVLGLLDETLAGMAAPPGQAMSLDQLVAGLGERLRGFDLSNGTDLSGLLQGGADSLETALTARLAALVPDGAAMLAGAPAGPAAPISGPQTAAQTPAAAAAATPPTPEMPRDPAAEILARVQELVARRGALPGLPVADPGRPMAQAPGQTASPSFVPFTVPAMGETPLRAIGLGAAHPLTEQPGLSGPASGQPSLQPALAAAAQAQPEQALSAAFGAPAASASAGFDSPPGADILRDAGGILPAIERVAAKPMMMAPAPPEALPRQPEAPLQQHVARQIRAVDLTEGRTRIELAPHGIGDLEIELYRAESGKLQIALRAENVSVLHALRNDRDTLLDALQSKGIAAESGDLDFQTFGERDRGRQQAETEPRFGAATDDPLATPLPQSGAVEASPVSSGPGRLDILT